MSSSPHKSLQLWAHLPAPTCPHASLPCGQCFDLALGSGSICKLGAVGGISSGDVGWQDQYRPPKTMLPPDWIQVDDASRHVKSQTVTHLWTKTSLWPPGNGSEQHAVMWYPCGPCLLHGSLAYRHCPWVAYSAMCRRLKCHASSGHCALKRFLFLKETKEDWQDGE